MSHFPQDKQALNQPISHCRANNVWRSFGYAFSGLAWVLKTQRNFKIHCGIALIVILTAVLLQVSQADWYWLIAMIGLMLVVECLNTALEAVVDLSVGENYHPIARQAKDVAAAGCFLCALTCMVIGALIFSTYWDFPLLQWGISSY